MRDLDGGWRVFIARADPHSKSIESQSHQTSTEQIGEQGSSCSKEEVLGSTEPRVQEDDAHRSRKLASELPV